MLLRMSLFFIIFILCSSFAHAYLKHNEIVELFDDEKHSFEINTSSVDLRHRDTLVKQQFGNTSTTFAVIAAMENALDNPDVAHLSERHLWSLYRESSPGKAIAAAHQRKITEEYMWAQNKRRPRRGYLDRAHTKLTGYTYHQESIEKVVQALDLNNPIVGSLNITSKLGSCSKNVDESGAVSPNSHSLAIVGYGLDERVPGGGYLIAKNSWGRLCGDEGYQYIAFSYCLRNAIKCEFWEIDRVETSFPR